MSVSVGMSPSHLMVCAAAFLSYVARTAMTCLALEMLIDTAGAGQLGRYYSLAAVLTIVGVVLVTYGTTFVAPTLRFLVLHALFLLVALACLAWPDEHVRAQLLFLTLVSLGLLIYFHSWSLASRFINNFEAPRLYPRLSAAIQLGVGCGAALAMGARFGISESAYLWGWLLVEAIVVTIAAYLAFGVHRPAVGASTTAPTGCVQLLKRHRLMLPVMGWVLVWGVLYAAAISLTGQTFAHAHVNLTALYGALTLGGALLSSLAALLYPKVVRWVRLSTMLLVASFLIALVFNVFLWRETLLVGIVTAVLFELMDSSFVALTLSNKFSLYNQADRDRVRLLAEILAQSIGAALVAVVLTVHAQMLWLLLGGLCAALVALGLRLRHRLVREMLLLFDTPDREEKHNAILLFDSIEVPEAYQKLLDLLVDSTDPVTQVHVLHTFANLKTLKPAASVIRLFAATGEDAIRMAILQYLSTVGIGRLDPFLQYQLLDLLKDACRDRGTSGPLRSLAICLLVQHGPVETTVSFVLRALQDPDERTVANAIEGLSYINSPGVIELLLPFLDHPTARIRANAIVALWPYIEARYEAGKALKSMLESATAREAASGVYAVGEVRATEHLATLRAMRGRPEKELQRGVPVALLKLGDTSAVEQVIDLILGPDESQAVNVCYLCLRIDRAILNEQVISAIFERGEAARGLASARFAESGWFCQEQLDLLAGRMHTVPH